MSVHYKFKSALDFDTITFDGLHISVSDLKKAIIHQKRLGKTADFDLQITNAQTKEEYTNESSLIPKNTSLIIARIPLANQPKKPWDPQAEKNQNARILPELETTSALDLSQMNGTEEDKIQAMMIQSTMDYDPNNYQKIRGQGQTGEVPANYRCFKCHKPGHWIKNCPLGSGGEVIDIKRNTGIPRSFIERDSQEKPTTMAEKKRTPSPVIENKQEIPEDLICSICKDVFTDAVMIPCCGSSFCDECVRTALLESEDNECPDCKEKGSSPGSLIPNRFLRNSVNVFKNETGYSNKPRQKQVVNIVEESEIVEEIVEIEANDKDVSEEPPVADPEIKETKIESDKLPAKDVKSIVENKPEKEVESPNEEIESDYEDNITVTVPPAHITSQAPPSRERNYNGKNSRLKPPGIENSPKVNFNSREESSDTPANDEKEGKLGNNIKPHHHIQTHHNPIREHMHTHRSTPSDMYSNIPPVNSYPPQHHMMAPIRPYEMGGYGPPPSGYMPYMMNERMRAPFHPLRPGYPMSHPMRPRHISPVGSLASVYQGVAAKVGSGIIDDPLEAFNRIMREKEKRKEERRRSPFDSRRRSRSIEMNSNRGRHSPIRHDWAGRTRSPDDRRLRSSPSRLRRGRTREKHQMEKSKHRQRSSSFSDRSSRSRSWSGPRKRTMSPMMRRRTHSRSPSFPGSRSRSRSLTPGRFRGPSGNFRYNRASPNTANVARYNRQRENRRPDRREEYSREEYVERSPYHYQSRRGRSRGRVNSPAQYMKHERHGNEQYFSQPGGMFNEGHFNHNRYHHPRDSHRGEAFSNERGINYKMDRFDDGPPGTDEPPPPGYENSPTPEKRNIWHQNVFDDRLHRNDFRQQDGGRKIYSSRNESPEHRDKQTPEREERRRQDGKERDKRSWSKTSRQSSSNNHNYDKRKRSRSRTPHRFEKAEERVSKEHPNKEKRSSKEPRIDDSRDKYTHDRERIEYENKREKEDKLNSENLKEKHENERKDYMKDGKKAPRVERDKEKEKKRDSSDDEKKDKKAKEKKKRKKEKEEKKKIKKEKKERGKKEKEKENEHKIETSGADEEKETVISEDVLTPDGKHLDKQNKKLDENKSSSKEVDKIEKSTKSNSKQEESKDVTKLDELDLYGDICQKEEIRFDYNTKLDEENSTKVESRQTPEIKRFDSVLDIHANLDFEPDIEEPEGTEVKKSEPDVFVPLPELSKWEREEESHAKDEKLSSTPSLSQQITDEKGVRVTNEVIKRAENAIFARAINVIRPIEIKKISVERQKLYANEMAKDISPVPSVLVKPHSPNKELPTFQITVPTDSNKSERSVEIKTEKSRRSPVRSVKDRLGSKVLDCGPKRNKSNSSSPSRRITLEGRIEKINVQRSRSREIIYRREEMARERDDNFKRGNDNKRSTENLFNRQKIRDFPPFKIGEGNRMRDQRNFNRRRDFQERGRDRNFDIDRFRDKEKFREQRRTPERFNDRSRERFNERPNLRFQQRDIRFTETQNENEFYKSKQHIRDERSHSHASEKNKQNKSHFSDLKDSKRKYNDNNQSPAHPEKRSRINKRRESVSEEKSIRKKSTNDEANTSENQSKQNTQKYSDKVIMKNTDKRAKSKGNSKTKSPHNSKRAHSGTDKSSTSSSSATESDTDSDENKKKKKRKHKKEKKKSRRSSSPNSTASNKHKRSKSKKKAKSSKKKKKSKK